MFEFEAYPEPKILKRAVLMHFIRLHGTTLAVAKLLGCSQAYVSERL
jgi:predicted transcriptional regulator